MQGKKTSLGKPQKRWHGMAGTAIN